MGLFIMRHGKQDIILSNGPASDGKEASPQSMAEFIPVTNDLPEESTSIFLLEK